MLRTMHDVVVVGGGAAGLATAIFTARLRSDLRVAVVDGARTLGAKILVSGGGRCNVTNVRVTERDFNGATPAAIRAVLRALPVDDTIAWFAAIGVPLHEEALGKLFPDSNRSRDVLDALLGDAQRAGVRILPATRIGGIERDEDGFRLTTTSGPLHARVVVLATGGLALPKSGSDGAGYTFAEALGHSIVPTTPALVPLVLDGDRHVALSGVSHNATLRLWNVARPRTITGSFLWTHAGCSGPAVLDVSRHWLRARLEGMSPTLALDSVGESFDAVDAWWTLERQFRPRAHPVTVAADRVPRALAERLALEAGVAADATMATLTRDTRRRIVHAMTALHLDVRDSRGYTHAEVTAGGVALSEVDPATMHSRRCPGLYLVGEVLDVDGRLGGFNFQWAWASAMQAARGICGHVDSSVTCH